MSRFQLIRFATLALTLLLAFAAAEASAQVSGSAAAPLAILKVDPPNWYAGFPKPMLLIRGEGLTGVKFVLSDPLLKIERTHISENGHWAQIFLATSPARAETIKLRATRGSSHVDVAYAFASRRPVRDGIAGFTPRDILYLIMTDRFADGDLTNDGPDASSTARSPEAIGERAKPRGWHGGDLRGVTNHLDYLQSLGVTTIWVTPVTANEGEEDSYHGYGTTDMYKVDPHYGTIADLRALGDALHKRQMKLVMDMVPNHVGPINPWVLDAPEPDWFHGTAAMHSPAVGEFAPLVDPHAPWRDQKNILNGWFADVLPDMNEENPDVSQYLIQNTIWWVEQAGADGLRIDTFPYVPRPFWHAYHAELHTVFPQLTSVGEIFNGDPAVTSAFAGGVARNDLNGQVDTGLWTPFDFPTYFALRDVLLKGAAMSQLAKVWGQDSLYPHPERLVPFLGNHDTARFISMPGATAAKLKLAFAILLTMRGTPQIYAGDEIAMQGGDDPDNRHDYPGGFPDNNSAHSPLRAARLNRMKCTTG